MDYFEALRQIWFFAPLIDQDLVKMIPHMEFRTYVDGASVVCQGDPSPFFGVIAVGACQISQSGVPVAVRHVGGAIGEMGFFMDIPRTATATAIGKTTIMILTREKLDMLCENEPLFAARIQAAVIREIARKLQRTNQDLCALKRESAEPNL